MSGALFVYMAKQRLVSTKFWDDSYIMHLNPTEKLLFLYLITNSLTNICGIYEISLQRIMFDTKIVDTLLENILKKFKKDKKVVYKSGWVYVVNFIKNQNLNPSVVEGIKRELGLINKQVLDSLGTDCDRLVQEGTLNLTKPNLTKLPSGKPFFKNCPMIKKFGKWYVIEKGGEILFTGKESEIIYK